MGREWQCRHRFGVGCIEESHWPEQSADRMRKNKQRLLWVGMVGQAGKPSKAAEEFDLLGLNTVGGRKPQKALGQRNDSWTLRKQNLPLLEHCRWPSEHTRHECAGSWCKCLLYAGELLCCNSAHACASVCQVAACPRPVLHVPASGGAGQWEVGEVYACCLWACVSVCACGALGPHSMCVHARACACACPPPPGLPHPCV